MKLLKTALVAVLMQMVETNRHCHRYHYCVTKARNDYEQCVGGVAAAIIADNSNIEIINILPQQYDRMARQHENEDILRCINVFITHSSFKHISDIKKVACTETPSSWNLRDLVGDSAIKPSQCREIYDLEIQRCLFLLTCCPVYSLCVASVSLNSTIHSKVISLKKKIASDANQCLSPDFAMMNEEPIRKHSIDGMLNTNIMPSDDCTEKMRCVERADLNKSENEKHKLEISVGQPLNSPFTSILTTSTPSQENVSLIAKETLLFPKQLTLPSNDTRFTEPAGISLNGSRMTDASPDFTVLGSDETLESQLSVSDNNGRNGSRISAVCSEENIAFCEDLLVCEEKLKLRELMCQRQCAYPNLILESKTKLFDMSVQAEIITNFRVADITESISKACMRPVTSDVLEQLSDLLHKMVLNRKSCMRRITSNQDLLSIRNKTKTVCEGMKMYATLDEKKDTDKNKCNNLTIRKNAFDYCRTIVAPIEEQCMALRQCCPNYVRCTELMMQTSISRKYNEILSRIKQIQSKCEKKIMATLRSLHSSFSSFSYKNTGDCL